jgi:hypothetical protein
VGKLTLYSMACWLAPTVIGRIEYKLRRSAGILPMNGQAARLEIVREIFELCLIRRVVETGTFRGATTEWLAQFGKPVTAIEINPVYAAYCRARLRAYENVQIKNLNSIEGLKFLIDEIHDRATPIFFYLDAHWYDYLPLKQELKVILVNFEKPVVMIDDFQVPDDPDYRFDKDNSGEALTIDYIQQAKIPLGTYFFPKVRGRWETGAKRGSVVITTHSIIAEQLRNAPLLRAWRDVRP